MTVILEVPQPALTETSVEVPLTEAAVIAEADAAVAIAEIQEEGATAREEIRAEASVEAMEALAPTVNMEEGIAECQRNIGTLTTAVETLSLKVQLILADLEEVEEAEAPPSQNESPASAEVVPQEPEAESPPEPVKKKPRINWT